MAFNDNYLEDIDYSPIFPDNVLGDLEDFEKEKDSQVYNEELISCTDNALTQLNNTMFSAANNSGLGKNQDFMSTQGSEMSEPWLNDIDLLQITENDPDPPSMNITVNPVDIYQTSLPVPIKQENIAQPEFTPLVNAPVKTEPVSSPTATNRPSRQRRKSTQTSRNVQDSPMMFQEPDTVDLRDLQTGTHTSFSQVQDIKPFALAPMNGARTRNPSTSSTKSMAAAASSLAKSRKESQERRKRKYEEEDDTDPSVKNAKAAKLNREKKKQQMNTLQAENTNLKARIAQLEQENEDLKTNASLTDHLMKQEVASLRQQLAQEKAKNSTNSVQGVRMLNHIAKIVQVIHPTPQVYVANRLADLPAPSVQDIQDAKRLILQGDPSADQDDESTYLTVKNTSINLD
ncbi:hypothetical protein Ocin01_01781 [Orchesella cincta]|uniref:BZIP domain-containing protein n=1 Tax=Orchesella cincta TaxID=48709 RepID=A0A1D2NHY8_ORCCI|nr:hypothetical protein Ocin01_01781 [Orchesella cincta]